MHIHIYQSFNFNDLSRTLSLLLLLKTFNAFIFLASFSISFIFSLAWKPMESGHKCLLFFSMMCIWNRCFLPSRCCLNAFISMHHILHISHHFLWLEISPPLSLFISNLFSSILCFFPFKCKLSKSSLVHGTLHSSHHFIWLLVPSIIPFFWSCLQSCSLSFDLCFRPIKCCVKLNEPEHDNLQILQYDLSWISHSSGGSRGLLNSFLLAPERHWLELSWFDNSGSCRRVWIDDEVTWKHKKAFRQTLNVTK